MNTESGEYGFGAGVSAPEHGEDLVGAIESRPGSGSVAEVESEFDEQYWRTRLREAGLRSTAARLAIIKTLESAGCALAAQEVIDRLDLAGTDRVTVYRTLGSLVEVGLAHRLDPGDRVWRFSLQTEHVHSTDPDDDHAHHPHFVCLGCGTVGCLEGAAVRVSMGRHTDDGYVVAEQEVLLKGYCPDCGDRK